MVPGTSVPVPGSDATGPAGEPEHSPDPTPDPAGRSRGRGAAPARVRSAAALLAAAALGFGASELAQRQEQAAAQRQVDATVELALGPDDGQLGTSVEQRGDGPGVRLGLGVEVVNRGPAEVELLGVTTADGLLSSEAGRMLAPGEPELVSLTAVVATCPDVPPQPDPTASRLVLQVRTAAGERSVELAAPAALVTIRADALSAACGFDAQVGALLTATGSRLYGDLAALDVLLINGTRRGSVVTDLLPGRGLDVAVLALDGDPLGLPLTLPGGDFAVPRLYGAPDGDGLRLRLEVRVGDCAQAASDREGLAGPVLEARTVGGQGSLVLFDDDGAVSSLVEAVCG